MTWFPQALLVVAAWLCAVASGISWVLFFTLYWPHRHRFDATGRHVDVATAAVHHEQTGVLVFPALVFLVLAVLLGALWRHRRRTRATGVRSG